MDCHPEVKRKNILLKTIYFRNQKRISENCFVSLVGTRRHGLFEAGWEKWWGKSRFKGNKGRILKRTIVGKIKTQQHMPNVMKVKLVVGQRAPNDYWCYQGRNKQRRHLSRLRLPVYLIMKPCLNICSVIHWAPTMECALCYRPKENGGQMDTVPAFLWDPFCTLPMAPLTCHSL